MVKKITIKGIAFLVLMLSIVLIAMAGVPTITFNEPPTPTNGATVNVDYVNISVTLNESGTALVSWDGGANVSMTGSGTSFYYNQTLLNGLHTYIVYANDATPANWTSSTRTVTVSVASPSSPSAPSFTILPSTDAPTASSVNISFSLNQTNALTNIQYGTTPALGSWAAGDNTTSTTRSIFLSGLSPGTPYYYSVYAYNSTNQNNFINSTINPFTTSTPSAPGFTIVPVVDTLGAYSVNISFSLNQTNALTNIQYGTTPALGSWAAGDNTSSLTRKIVLPGLVQGTPYYYSVFAYSGDNQSYFINSTIDTFTTTTPSAPSFTSAPAPDSPILTSVNISFSLNQSDALTNIQYGTTPALGSWTGGDNSSSTTRKIFLPGLSQGTTYYYSVFAYNNSNQSYFINSTISNFTTTYPAPQTSSPSPSSPIETTGIGAVNFAISFTQVVNVTWLMNGNPIANSSVNSVTSANLNPTPSIGTWNITVTGSNINGTASYSWNWTVHPKTYAAGNRIWDGSRPDLFSLKYTWNPMSFPGFYYDINSDVGNESITMTMNSYTDRTVDAGNIVYDTSPEEVKFGYKGFGSYQVIGFMADKYFAGYTANTTINGSTITVGAKSTLGQRQLHKVLYDDDTKRTISVGSTLTLQEGYVLKATDISTSDRIMLVSLLKDGNEVDTATLQAGQTYVYAPSKVGTVSDLPILMVRFDSVFSGTEVQAAFLKGVFQISSNPTTLKTGDMYQDMKVTTVGQNLIEMKNDADVNLGKGNTENLMGNVNILVADNDTLRFALSTVQTGTFEVRSTVYRDSDPSPIDTWNPYNFGMNIGKTSVGFYYDLDDGIGNETLRLAAPLNGSRTIAAKNLVYTTVPQEVSFGYAGFGSYQVIGFMAKKYFAGYTINSTVPGSIIAVGAKSTLGQRQLHAVLIDDDTKRTISVGSTLTLQEGYVLKATDISTTDRIMLVSLLKDGNEVDTATLQAGQTYVYAPSKVGTVSDLPIIMVRFDSVFSGTEVQAAFLKGVFQISSNPTTLKTGDTYNDMTLRTVGQDKIEMSNDNDISLDNGKSEQLMGDINLKVGDTTATDNALRFYFAVDVTPAMVANQLLIDAPAKATAGDVLNIKVTAGGAPLDGVSLAINSVDAGQTDKNGLVNYTLPRTLKGIYNITATKLGFQQDTKPIEVLQYVDLRLSIDAPATANQFSPINIKITYNGSAISGATVGYDNATIGTTDNNGVFNYTPQTSGTHTISVSKTGYITAVRDINVRAPFSQYQALDINITPGTVSVNEAALITSNITNVGTKADTLPVELISNGTVVDNQSVSLAPGETKEISFTRKEALPGNYTIEIIGQKGILEVKEQPLNLPLIAVGATVIGLVAIYLLTAKGLLGNLLGKFKGIGGIKK
ncbi:MAG: S-layer protein domain-containing protein [Candidatus Methanoperedens sp.]